MPKIAYLHGLGSNNQGPKNQWLHSFADVFDPQIDYSEENIYQKLKSKIQKFKPDLIVGSSMGGFFAYLISRELNFKALLFNPALHSRSIEPDLNGFEEMNFQPFSRFVFGENDEVINAAKSIEILKNEGFDVDDFVIYSHQHDTPFNVFQNEINAFLNLTQT